VLPSGGDARELDETAAQVTWRLARTAQVLAKVQSTEAGRLWAVTTGRRPEATYLITGGLGVLGLEVARWLVSRGVRRLILAGRTGLPPSEGWDHVTEPGLRNRIEVACALEALGVTVRILALDVSDLRQSRRLLDTNDMGLPPVRGVVHAAGVLDNRMLHDLDEESLRRVMRPKVTGGTDA